jgi:hypothetical protein
MRLIVKLLKTLSIPPALRHRHCRPSTAFNRFQFWACPELCREQAHQAMQHLPQELQQSHRAKLAARFGAPF